jgi:hypothetical protein
MYYTTVGCGIGMPLVPIPEATFDRSRAKRRHNDNRSPKPHVLNIGALPSGTMDEVREKIDKLFRNTIGVSVSSLGQSYQRPHDPRWDTIPYALRTSVPDFSKFLGEGSRVTHEHTGQFLAQLRELPDIENFHVRLV